MSEYLYGFDLSDEVFIHDKLTDIYYDIKNGVFDMTLPAGDNKTRFEITFIYDGFALLIQSSKICFYFFLAYI